MAKAKLTTRGISSSTVTSDNLAKGSQLTHNQLDSNFINLRDQTFGIAADDSATIQVGAGDTLYIQGGSNVTTSTDSAGVVTINATGEVTASSTTTFTNKTFDADATGNSLTNIEVTNLKSGVLDTDLNSVSGSDDTIASAKAIKSYVDASTGAGFKVVGDDSASVDIAEGGTVYIQGGTNITTSTDSAGVVTIDGAGTATSLTTDGLTIVDNNITGTRSAEDIVISTNSSGNIILDGYKVQIGDDDSAGPNPWRYHTDTNPPTIQTPNANDDLVFKTTPSDPNVGGHFVFQGGGDPRVVLRSTSPTGGAHHLGPGGINGTLNIYGGGVLYENSVDKPNLFNVGWYSAKITLHSGDGASNANADIDITPLGTGHVNLAKDLDMNDNDIISGGTITGTLVQNDAIKLQDNKIITTRSNDNLEIDAAGAGEVEILTNTSVTGTLGVTGASTLDGVTITDNTISTNASNANLEISANGSGKVSISGIKYPTSDGSADQVLKTDGSGNLSFVAQSGGSASTGDITFVGSTMISPSNADITLNPAGTGKVNINAVYTLPNADGSANQVLGTNGSGVLSFRDPTAINIDGGVADSTYTSVPTIDGGTA